MRFPVAWCYITVSLLVIAGMAYDEGARHRAFFPTVTALSSNNLFHVALANGFFASLYLTCWVLTTAFLGKLDQSERLSVTEKFFVCFLDSVLGLAIFRTGLNYWTVVQVTCTLAWRILHHLAMARQESMEQAVRMTFLRMVRYMSLLTLLFVGDVAVSIYFFDVSRRDGIGLPTLLCVDYMVMCVLAVSVASKTLLQLYEQFRGGIWEPRGTYRFYCDIATEALSCVFYIGFFIVVTSYTTTPFHIVRHLIDNLRRLTRAVRDCATYRSLVAKLAKLEDPTEQQLAADGTCSVCLGDIEVPAGSKRLPCGHCFHSQCLTRWLERNNNCPYCRQEIEGMLARAPVRAPPAPAQPAPVPHPAAAPAAAAAVAPPAPGAAPAAAPGRIDPFDALQDDEAIRRMYQQYLRLHREAAGIHRAEALEPVRAPRPAAEPAAAAVAPNTAAATPAATSETPAAASAAPSAADETSLSQPADPIAVVPASPSSSDTLDRRRVAAAAAEARMRAAAAAATDAVADAEAAPTETAPSAPVPTPEQSATLHKLQRRLRALEAYRATIQAAERKLDAELALIE